MVSFLKGRRKTDDAVVAVDSSGAHITVALETLVARAETALEQLRAMSGVLDRTAEIDALRESRGGSHESPAYQASSAMRTPLSPSAKVPGIGLRPCRRVEFAER